MRGAGSKSIAIPIEGRNAVAKKRMLCGVVKGRPESSKISASIIVTIPEIAITFIEEFISGLVGKLSRA